MVAPSARIPVEKPAEDDKPRKKKEIKKFLTIL
jgi:hypothetical protein